MLGEVVAIAEDIAEIDCCFVFVCFFTVGFFVVFVLSNSCDVLVMIFRVFDDCQLLTDIAEFFFSLIFDTCLLFVLFRWFKGINAVSKSAVPQFSP